MKTKLENKRTLLENSSVTLIEDENLNISKNAKLERFKDYRVLKQLPTLGAEADLYLLEKDKRKYILKLYRLSLKPKEEIFKILLNISKRENSNIIKIYEIDKDTDRWYEIQEYANFGSLKDLMGQRQINKTKLTNKLLGDMLNALTLLHGCNIIHRDLKPDNILISRGQNGNITFKVTDFGISSILEEDLTRRVTSKSGTIIYFAPESFSGYIGKEVDYWALGIIIFEILMGVHPFKNLNTAIIHSELSTKGIEVPEDILDDYKLLLKGLLTRDYTKRWGEKEVRRWLNGERDIPIHYNYNSNPISRPYEFDNRKFTNLKSLIEYMYQDKYYQIAREHIMRGYVTGWLEDIKLLDEAIEFDELREKTKNVDLNIFLIYMRYIKPDSFIFMGKYITLDNLLKFVTDYISSKASPVEIDIVGYSQDGILLQAYRYYLNLNNKSDKKLLFILERASNSNQKTLDELFYLLKIVQNSSLAYKVIQNYEKIYSYKEVYNIFDTKKYILYSSLKKKIENREEISLREKDYILENTFLEYNKIRKKFGLKQISKKDLISSEELYLETLNGVKNGIKNYETFLIIDSELKSIQKSFFYEKISSDSDIIGYNLSEFIKNWNSASLDLTPEQLMRIKDFSIPKIKETLAQNRTDSITLFLAQLYASVGFVTFILTIIGAIKSGNDLLSKFFYMIGGLIFGAITSIGWPIFLFTWEEVRRDLIIPSIFIVLILMLLIFAIKKFFKTTKELSANIKKIVKIIRNK
jgi:serine/threonine protein kinase